MGKTSMLKTYQMYAQFKLQRNDYNAKKMTTKK